MTKFPNLLAVRFLRLGDPYIAPSAALLRHSVRRFFSSWMERIFLISQKHQKKKNSYEISPGWALNKLTLCTYGQYEHCH